MQRMKCIIAYDGTDFSGYQVQPNARTVQGELERVLQRIHKGEAIRVAASGRTDAGVHAKGQVIHFDSPLQIPGENWVKALNALLPDDIHVLHAEPVAKDFHARFNSKRKEYRYRILQTPERDLFRRHYAYHVPVPLNVEAMREAAKHLIGKHDFTSFCASGTSVLDKVRTIYQLDVEPEADELVIRVIGNGFLYQMVRIITGTLIEVGKGKLKPSDVIDLLEAKDRSKVPETAPPQGLYLWRVDYEEAHEISIKP